MKKRLLALLCALALCLGLLPAPALAAEEIYLALGDSITTGYTPPGMLSITPFPRQVADDMGYALNNQAENGETTASLLARLNGLSGDIAAADVITLTIGGNDLMNALYDYLAEKTGKTVEEVKADLTGSSSNMTTLIMTYAQHLSGFGQSPQAGQALTGFGTNLAQIVTAIKTWNPDVVLLVATQYNPYSYLASDPMLSSVLGAFDAMVQTLNASITALAGRLGFSVADVYTAFEEAVDRGETPCNPSLNPFTLDFHPNQAGHDLIAQTVLAALPQSLGLPIDEAHFPDEHFRDYVSNRCDSNFDGYLSASERENVTDLDLNYVSITSLEGIEWFSSLTYLDCSYNDLTELDLSQNPALTELNCEGNDLTKLDLTANHQLTDLNCSSNQLTALALPQTDTLTRLDCTNNALTELDLTANTALTYLGCASNQLTTLDLSANPDLTYLYCSDNQLTGLDLSANPDLTYLSCSYNNLTDLDLTANTALTELYCYQNQLTDLDLTANTALTELWCFEQAPVLAAGGEALDLAALVADWSRVSGLSATGGTLTGSTLLWDGVSPTSTVTYGYDTGSSIPEEAPMDVTLTVTWTGGAPTLTGSAVRTGADTADVTFTSPAAGTCYAIASDTEILLTGDQIAAEGTARPCGAGENTFPLTGLSQRPQYLALVVRDGLGQLSRTLRLTVPAYTPTVYAVTPDTSLVPVTTPPEKDEGRDAIQSASVESSDHGSATLSPRRAAKGETVTVTVTPEEGYVLASLTVKDAGGNPLTLMNEGDNTYTFTMPGSKVTVEARFQPIQAEEPEPEPAPLPFSDVNETAWYAGAVAYVYENGLMTGTSGTAFSPDATTSRSMVATILWRMAGSPVVNYAMDFADVAQGQWYSEAVRWAASEGVVTGYGDAAFGVNDPVTREQLAIMLYRFAQAQGWDVSIGESTNLLSYADAADVSEWAIPALQWACGAGVLEGNGSGLNPQGRATRAELAALLARFCEGALTR